MSKGLEAFDLTKRTCELFIKSSSHLIGSDIIANQINEALDTIKQTLLELKQIKEAEPSEALKCVGVLKEEDCITTLVQGKALETIRQYILKAQKMERVLEIIFEKNVTIFWLKECKNLEEYNYNTADHMKLTKEEYNLLKEWLEDERNTSKI